MALYRDHGIVLRTYKLGESDRIVNIMTRENGKVRAVAKGVRKTRSRFGSRLEPGSHVALQLYQGRSDLDIISQAETVDHFRRLREDLDALSRAASMLEVVDQMAQEREQNARMYQMLLGGLRTLASNDSPLVVAAFFWKLLSLEGFQPQTDACVVCGATTDLVAFDIDTGGTLCRNDRRGVGLSTEARELLAAIVGGRLNDALRDGSGEPVAELDRLATQAMEYHLERRLRSVNVVPEQR